MPELKRAYDEAIAQLTADGSPYALTQRSIDGVEYTVYANAPKTILDIWEAASQHGDAEFLVYEGERYTFSDMLRLAAKMAVQLRETYGVEKGDRVAIAMRNYPEWMIAYIAVTSIGAVVVPLNSWDQARELEYAINDADAKVVFCDHQRYALVADWLEERGTHAVIARPQDTDMKSSASSWESLMESTGEATMPSVEIDPEDPVMILYTSGTTGAPKGALSTHRALCQALTNFEVGAFAFAMINPETMQAMMSSGHPPTQLLAVPLFHVSGLHAVFLGAFKGGRRVVMMFKWDAEKALELIEQERVTAASAAPAMILQLLESADFDERDTSSLSSIGAGGAATPPRAARLIEEKLPQGYPGTGWGMTETNAIGSSFTGASFKKNPGSAGHLHPTVQLSVRDEDGNELPQGEAGELWIKSPTVISEYWNRPDANAKDFKDGWFNSGDIGYLDDNGYLYLSDRAKDMVIRGGENIYPAEIEGCLHDHPDIEEVAAFGLPDEAMGEQLAVAAVPRSGSNLDVESVRAFAKENLAHFKVPHYVFLLDEALPRNPSGKVLKKDLKARFESEAS